MLYLSILMENSAAEGFEAEHGLSFLLESDDMTILFDTGASAAFLNNASRMGCNLGAVTHIVLSHGHYDHTGGLGQALRHIFAKKNGRELPPLIAHPNVLGMRRRSPSSPLGAKDIGMPPEGRKALEAWPRILTRTPVWLREDAVFLGEIPRAYPDCCALVGEAEHNGTYGEDAIPDDSALAFVTDDGLIIVAGCSHSGIVNILEHAKNVTGVSRIHAVYGGLHCKDMTPPILEKTRAALKAEDLAELYACHCTGDALAAFPGRVDLAAGERRRLQ